ncbi:Hypothetical_protein [Hexamita inflata]|uniref:Hypothetical_protein n=1 Tax=Hexamita inflata TaxID=28002 RepID=A0AA86UHB7_9EUKA|nr:Hypothetical protein HINF_LOCUS38807 [Hexamita inflata]
MIYQTCIDYCTNGICGYQYIQQYDKYEFECIQNPKNIFNTFEFCENNCLTGRCNKVFSSQRERFEYECVKDVSYKSSGYSWFLIIPAVIALIIGISVCIYKKTRKTPIKNVQNTNVQNTFVVQNVNDQVIVAEQQ